jgi:hypothetical protein
MAPVTQNTQAYPQPAVSLLLVKPSNQAQNSTIDTTDMSRNQLMQMIYTLMLLVGKNMSLVQTTYAQSQLNQETIVQRQAQATQTQTTKYMSSLQELQQKEAEAKKWELFGTVMKWVGVAAGLLVGALLCETPVGFFILAAVIAYTASPLFDMTTKALGGAIGKAIGNSTWGNIIAQVIILVTLTVLTCGAEGLSTGLSKLATTAGEDAAESATQAAAQTAKEVAEQVTQEISEDAAQASKVAEGSSNKVAAKDFKPRWTFASASVFTQTVMSSNISGELITQLIEAIPGNEKAKKMAETILTVVFDLLITLASFKFAASAGNLLEQASKLTSNPALLRGGIAAFTGATQITTAAAEGGQGYNQYQQSQIQQEMAPLQANMQFGQGFFQILTQLANLAQQIYKSLMDSNKILFTTNFAADWQACVSAQQYQG